MLKGRKIFFRTDASLVIGTGHVMRCLTLADAIRNHGGQCSFICKNHEGNLADLIAKKGFAIHLLPVTEGEPQTQVSFQPEEKTDCPSWLGGNWLDDARQTCKLFGEDKADWIVVDHYAIDHRWESEVRRYCRRLMAIDDLANRRHDCDLLLDQNLGRTEHDYNGLLSDSTQMLIGPNYALLRPEFAQLRVESLMRRVEPRFKRLLITMGGVDRDNATCCVLDALNECALPDDLKIAVVMGANAPWLLQVQAQAAQMHNETSVLVGVNDMAQLMVESDFAIGAAGGTALEMCCLGLPSFLLVLADNQKAGAKALHDAGASLILDHTNISKSLQVLLHAERIAGLQKRMARASSAITDGCGTELVVKEMKHGFD